MINETMALEFPRNDREAYITCPDGRILPIEKAITIGRDPHNSVVINDPHVSAFHCQVEKRPAGYFVRDHKSRNGVIVNGLRVAEIELVDGVHFMIGNSVLSFHRQKPLGLIEDLPIKTKNLEWQNQVRSIVNVAQSDLPVYIQGESGSGKEVLARLVHEKSSRAFSPFVSVNCSALTESLIESELFGHVRGSFTGAIQDRKGAFESARGGTLFLDEIGDLPLDLQPKLLRALENKEIRPVGSDLTVSTDVRILSATHKNLSDLVDQKLFRADLFYRIHVISIKVPPLRQRIEDLEDLVYYFCRESQVRLSLGAIEKMRRYSWPGNIRELRNVISRAKALFPDTYIQEEQISSLLSQTLTHKDPLAPYIKPKGSPVIREIEKEIIKSKLILNKGNQRKTAADLGIPKSTLHDRIKFYKIDIASLVNV